MLVSLLLAQREAAGEGVAQRDLATEIEGTFQAHYLASEFEAAEEGLLALIQECDASCSRSDLAKAWMYIGIVRGNGTRDLDAAQAAFEQALALDPQVQLDASVASPATIRRFAKAGGSVDTSSLPEPEPEAARAKPHSESELRALARRAGLVCGSTPSRLQTRRSLPVWCEARDSFRRVTLRYLAFNADGWVSIRMNKAQGQFRATIPCSANQFAGPLQYFITVTNRQGGLIATLGNLREPITVQVAENVELPPPAFPGESAPERCPVQETCPPDFPGCDDGSAAARGDADWGEPCDSPLGCKAGLSCIAGACEVSPNCDVDTDCESGICLDHRCEPIARAMPRHSEARSFVGVHFVADFGAVGGSDVCSTQDTEFDCSVSQTGQAYPGPLPGDIALQPGEPGDPYPGSSIGGAAGGTLRVLLSYDRVVLSKLTLGGRIGVAFNAGSSGTGSSAFLPLHLEARASYWLFGTEHARVQPFIFVAGGMAQVNLHKEITVRDCSTQPTRQAFEDCIQAEGNYEEPPPDLPALRLTARRELGRGFGSLGVAAFVPVFGDFGVVPAAQASFMFPVFGFVFQPSLGAMVAF